MVLGARGIDYIHLVQTTSSNVSTTTVAFPIYDCHGNEVATLTRNGSGYSLANQRSYGAWGEVRQGSTTGGPRGRYCANLGHVQDDETGLVYMRARYYEPETGRFQNSDPSFVGSNWFLFCSNDPLNRKDRDGKAWANISSVLEYMDLLVATWSACLQLSSMARAESMGITMMLNNLYDITDIPGSNAAEYRALKGATLIAITDLTLEAQAEPPTSNSIAAQAIGVIGIYNMGIEMAGWLLGLWGPGSSSFDMSLN